MRVMTFNVGNGLAPPSRLTEMLRASDADIVALQELATGQEAAVRDELAVEYPYQLLFGGGKPGKGLLSRWPILESEQIASVPKRPDLRATIQLPERTIHVAVAHPPPPRLHLLGLRPHAHVSAQIDRLLDLIAHGPPSILLGDFNMMRIQAQYRRVAASGLTDAFRAAGVGRGVTFPRRLGRWPLMPVIRIDYIWLSPEIRPLTAHVGPDAGSDHLPVIADLGWV
jgi:endonuclease/exonuclease/phosphatase family metal-dependent hydrolase